MTFDFSRLRALIVDDQMLVRTLVAQALRTMGFAPENLSQAVDGSFAKRTLEAKPIDIVLCDVQMEPMNGLDVLKDLRCGRTSNPPNLPFVFLSGHPEKSNIVIAAQLHADGFIIKPPKPVDMEKTLRLALTRPRPDIDPFSYYKVATGTAFDRHVFGELVTQASLLLDEDERPMQRLGLDAVKPGSRLARDLYNKTGQLLLLRGSEITRTQLRVLRQFPERFGVEAIEISCEPDSDLPPPSPTA